MSDDQGRPTPHAKVVLWNGIATRRRGQEAVTDARGEYRFHPVTSGAILFNDDGSPRSRHVGITVEHADFPDPEHGRWKDLEIPCVRGYRMQHDFILTKGS